MRKGKKSGTQAGDRPRILIVTPEITYLPHGMGNMANKLTAKAGGLADVSASLVAALFDRGADVHVALPHYRRMFHVEVGQLINDELRVYKSRLPFPEGKRVTALRIVAIPPKVQPHMNRPEIGVTADDPGKCVLGTVPVAEDGSANFLAPSNVTLFFQALDDDGVVVQTMRSGASLQPGQVWTCSGCHEPKDEASYTPTQQMAAAMKEEPAKITPEGEGSWPFRFDRLVAPVLKSACAACHTGAEKEPFAFKADPREAWKQLVNAGQPSVAALVKKGYNDATESVPGQGIAANAKLTKHIHRLWERGRIETADYRRLVLWMDVYGQYQGQFNDWQEQELADLRREWSATVLAGEQQQNAQVK
jgi:mono/diheme cytochrome c family protein